MPNEEKLHRSWRLHPSLILEQIGAVEHYYEEQARRGLVLESVGGWFDCFVHTAPCEMRYRAEPALPGEREEADWDRRQFYQDAGWNYLGTASDLHFFASPADSGAEELHTDPQDFAPMFRRQRRMNFWYSLIFSLLMLAILPLVFLSYLSYPPEPRDWVYLVGILFCLLVMLPGLIRDGRWLFQKRWQHLPAIDHRAKIPRGITLRARPLAALFTLTVVLAANLLFSGSDRMGFAPVSAAQDGQLVLTLAETDGSDLLSYNYPLLDRENNTFRVTFAPAGYWFYESDESAKTPSGAVVQLSMERASCRSEKMAKRVFEQMLDRYDWMEDKTSLAVPGFDEVLHWGGEPGRIGWYFVRSGNQAVFFYYEGRMEEEDLLALLAEHLADAQQTA